MGYWRRSNSVPWSSDKDDTSAANILSKLPHHINWKVLSFDTFMSYQSLYTAGLNGTRFRTRDSTTSTKSSLGHNATETFAKLQQAYGDSVLSRALVFWWFNAFSEGRESIEDEPRSGRPSVSKTAENVVRVRDLVRSDLNRFLASKNIPVAPQPPYSPDLSHCDIFLFPKLKNHLKEHHFGTLENIQTAVTDQMKVISISEFHQCYEEWKKILQRCVASEGSYFEGDNVEL
ncbi:uncharacterized protein TNCV_4705411 [Trichonephila clavipes]|nr:uncharacterized protein TNCV_4705411 [Trichonephila clavipes]